MNHATLNECLNNQGTGLRYTYLFVVDQNINCTPESRFIREWTTWKQFGGGCCCCSGVRVNQLVQLQDQDLPDGQI